MKNFREQIMSEKSARIITEIIDSRKNAINAIMNSSIGENNE